MTINKIHCSGCSHDLYVIMVEILNAIRYHTNYHWLYQVMHRVMYILSCACKKYD